MDSTPLPARYSARASANRFVAARLKARNARAWALTGSNVDCPAIEIDCLRSMSPRAICKISRLDQQCRICRGQSQCLAQCLSRTFPVIIEICLDRRPGEQRLRQVRFNGRALAPPRHAHWPNARRSLSVRPRWQTRQCQTCVWASARPRQRELGIQLHRVFVSSPGFARAFFRVAIFIKAALQIRFMRLDVFRPAFFRRLHFGLNLLPWLSGFAAPPVS